MSETREMLKQLSPAFVAVFVCLIVLGINGCQKSKPKDSGPTPTIAIPVEIPAADAEPIKQSVDRALVSATKAEAGLTEVLSKPAGPESLGKVSTARNDVSETKTELTNAKTNVIPELKRQLAAETANRHIAEAALRTNQENALRDATVLRDLVKDRDDEITKLKNEELRWIKWALGIASVILFVGGIACAVAGSMYGMVSGWKIAAIAWPCGAFCGMLAVYMNEILWVTLIVTIAVVVVIGGWILWRFFHHDPALTKAAVQKRKAKKSSFEEFNGTI